MSNLNSKTEQGLPMGVSGIEPRELAIDKHWYFNDYFYDGYRELICLERPAAFFLHYLYGIDFLSNLLADRALFGLREGSLTPLSQVFKDLLLTAGIIGDGAIRRQFSELQGTLSKHSAVIVPSATKVGEKVFVTAVILEGLENKTNSSASSCLRTSLRGDDFYVRQLCSLDEVMARFPKGTEDISIQTLDFTPTSIPAFIRAAENESKKELGLMGLIGLRKRMNQLREESGGILGGESLSHFLASIRESRTLADWTEIVNRGVNQCLLVDVLWPITFCIKPFLFSLRSASRHAEVRQIQLFDRAMLSAAHREAELCGQLWSQCSVATNLGQLFGRAPSERVMVAFFATMEEIIKNYQKLEKGIFA